MRKLAVLLATTFAGAALTLPAAPAHAATQYNTCGPKINIRVDMYGIQTIRWGNVLTGMTSYERISLRRGLKSNWGATGIWWARLDAVHGGIVPGDIAELIWTDHDPSDRFNVCRDDVKGEPFALTWGINSVYSGANPWHRRLFGAVGYTKASGNWQSQLATWDPRAQDWASFWVVSW